MDTTQNTPLFYLDEFNKIVREYNLKGMTNSKFCEIINEKAEKITSLNGELLEALKIMVALFSPTIDSREEIEQENAKLKAEAVIKKATETIKR